MADLMVPISTYILHVLWTGMDTDGMQVPYIHIAPPYFHSIVYDIGMQMVPVWTFQWYR